MQSSSGKFSPSRHSTVPLPRWRPFGSDAGAGGMTGWAGLLEVLAAQDHPERDDTIERVGLDLDLKAFDPMTVNRALALLKRLK